MMFARSSSALADQPRLRLRAQTVDHPLFYSVTKRLFPRMPRLVRERKMRILCLVTPLVLALCASLGFLLWLADRLPHT
jgi:hypothetical protein